MPDKTMKEMTRSVKLARHEPGDYIAKSDVLDALSDADIRFGEVDSPEQVLAFIREELGLEESDG